MPALFGALLEGFLELVYPTRCAGCDLPGELLCEDCRKAIASIDPATACPRCGAPFGWLVCTECWDRELSFSAGVSAGILEHPLSRAVTLYKDGGERRLHVELAALLSEAAGRWQDWADAVTYVPATDAAFKRRGFDHAAEFSRAVATLLGCPHIAALTRGRARDQRTLSRTDRFANAEGTFQVVTPLEGNVLLVDDVLTTGATLDAASSALLDAGAAEVRIATIARAW